MNLNNVQESLKDIKDQIVERVDSLFDKSQYNDIKLQVEPEEEQPVEPEDWYNDVC